MPRSRSGRAVIRLLFWFPTLAIVAALVAVGLRVGPWWPLSVAVATMATLAAASWVNRDVRRLRKIDPEQAAQVAGARSNRVGRLLVRAFVVWIAVGILAITMILVAHYAA
jgi:hypothetical protein